MTWEEAVMYFRSLPENAQIATDSYLEEDLIRNVNNFRNSGEWSETLKEISKLINNRKQVSILDIGAGNGISSISFALHGFNVTALEPDKSDTVGSGAITFLAEYYKLNNISITEAFGERLPFENERFDVIYGRQVMHHAKNLNIFVKEASRVLKTGGIFMTVRDHVIKDEIDKKKFLIKHPLHKYYGGENAFRFEEYKEAIEKAGLRIERVIKPSKSAINFSPWSKERARTLIKDKIGRHFCNTLFINLLWKIILYRLEIMPGRLFSFIAIKDLV
jgi:SAM-dependent methyltransferase